MEGIDARVTRQVSWERQHPHEHTLTVTDEAAVWQQMLTFIRLRYGRQGGPFSPRHIG